MKFTLNYGFEGCAPRSMGFAKKSEAQRAFRVVLSRCSLRFAELKSEDNSVSASYCNFV